MPTKLDKKPKNYKKGERKNEDEKTIYKKWSRKKPNRYWC